MFTSSSRAAFFCSFVSCTAMSPRCGPTLGLPVQRGWLQDTTQTTSSTPHIQLSTTLEPSNGLALEAESPERRTMERGIRGKLRAIMMLQLGLLVSSSPFGPPHASKPPQGRLHQNWPRVSAQAPGDCWAVLQAAYVS